ncbi:3-hydroxybutyryl-CoA dehydratase [Bombardia bombarda]|uniref:3-hydroxybutyryl-CoA dehydratase n=1 Tax=Bombardia bombarda TaxID=252184 RepID=A0AA39WGF3_9PEZI|nr:3-hydroxybutyryl-CoA dehydratase [Bombardia bombarda]
MALVDFSRYNDLPSLEEANAHRQTEGVEDVIGRLREVFIRHGAHNAFTLYLAHRHHQVSEDEAVVKVHGTAHLMSGQDMRDIQAVGNKIVPTTWMGSEMLPMEFAAVPDSEDLPLLDPSFAAEVASALSMAGFDGLFGIDTLEKEDWSELKIGNASVVVPSNGNERADAYIPVAFAFDETSAGFRVHGKCSKQHRHTSKPHDHMQVIRIVAHPIAMHWRDEWPTMPNGEPYDGKDLFNLVHSGRSPFDGTWDVRLLIGEIEEKLKVQILDIPAVDHGSNNYGFHIRCSNGPDMIARLARGDVNMPGFDGFPIHKQAPEAHFETAVYNLLRSEPDIRVTRLLYSRVPVQYAQPGLEIPQDLSGRRLFVFERSEGGKNIWTNLNSDNKLLLLDQLAHIRAALFRYNPPQDFAAEHLLKRVFEFMPDSLSMPVAPTREFWMHVLECKIKATIRDEGDMIGWEDDEGIVGPIALAAKQSLLRAIPHILPQETAAIAGAPDSLYRLVLEHGDFGIHNATIATSGDHGKPLVTSLYDWETGCICPALLSDPLVAAGPVDLIVDENGLPAVTRIPEDATQADHETYAVWSGHYFQQLYHHAPGYETVIQAGRDFRHLWFALRDWRGRDPEAFFGRLGAWAESRMKELGVPQASDT